MILLVAVLAWPVGLAVWANGQLRHVEALQAGGDDSGRTYLVAGSDRRGSGGVNDATGGARADSLLVVHVAPNQKAYLISLPRDTYVEIPGRGGDKINAAYAYGGAPLLVETVQQLTGLHIDRYVEVGFGSVTGLVDAVGGVKLCLDQTVVDRDSKLDWQAGCHDVDGAQALAFARMRKADPLGDIGRGARQRQVLAAVMDKAIEPSLLWHPGRQVELARAGTQALAVDEGASIVGLGRLILDFKAATGPDGVQGTPTIESLDYRPGGIGSAVLLDPEASARDFAEIRAGTWAGAQS
ncbi:MAG: LCP family protein [Bifidobacteriaceae bacterium]|jgi:LCP family protein required for cell wall assembly|nr:LCP family protein [Bifidobacteriaceae bacterium]